MQWVFILWLILIISYLGQCETVLCLILGNIFDGDIFIPNCSSSFNSKHLMRKWSGSIIRFKSVSWHLWVCLWPWGTWKKLCYSQLLEDFVYIWNGMEWSFIFTISTWSKVVKMMAMIKICLSFCTYDRTDIGYWQLSWLIDSV